MKVLCAYATRKSKPRVKSGLRKQQCTVTFWLQSFDTRNSSLANAKIHTSLYKFLLCLYVYKESFDPGWSKKQSHACNIVTRKDHQLIKFKLHLRENSTAGTLNSSVTPCLAHSVVKRETPEHWDGFRATFPFNSFPLIWPSLATYPSSITHGTLQKTDRFGFS